MRMLRAEATGPVMLRLEPQTAAHALEMFPLLSDPAIYRHENRPPASVARLLRRFTELEHRRAADGSERWLNWVVRIEAAGESMGESSSAVTDTGCGPLTGYVQATVDGEGSAWLAYEFAGVWWGRGIAFAAVGAMLDELAATYAVTQAFAVLKAANERSARLLQRLGFVRADPQHAFAAALEADEYCCSRTLG